MPDFCFNPRNWTLGISWGDGNITVALLCFGLCWFWN